MIMIFYLNFSSVSLIFQTNRKQPVKGLVWEYLGVNVCSSTATHIVNCKVLNAIKLFTVGYLAEEFVK